MNWPHPSFVANPKRIYLHELNALCPTWYQIQRTSSMVMQRLSCGISWAYSLPWIYDEGFKRSPCNGVKVIFISHASFWGILTLVWVKRPVHLDNIRMIAVEYFLRIYEAVRPSLKKTHSVSRWWKCIPSLSLHCYAFLDSDFGFHPSQFSTISVDPSHMHMQFGNEFRFYFNRKIWLLV